MRGWKELVRGVVLIGALAGLSGSVLAQSDPKVVPSFSNVIVNGIPLTQVTLARDDALTTFAAYDIAITNKTTNSLNRLYFTAKVKTVGSTDGSYAQFDYNSSTGITSLYLTPSEGTFTCGAPTASSSTVGGPVDTVELSCTSQISLLPTSLPEGTTQKITIPVKAPKTGTRLEASFTIGGYEGSSQTGQGCCAYPGSVTTALIDYTQDGTYSFTTQAVTFVKGDTGGRVYTGTKATPQPNTDLFTTDVNVSANFGAKYDIATISEKSIPDGTGRCKQSKLKICHETTISIPNVLYPIPSGDPNKLDASGACETTDPLLKIALRIDFSSIKGNPLTVDLTAIRLSYDETGDATKKDNYGMTVVDCSSTSGFPCVCGRTRDPVLKFIEFDLVNYKNGRLTAW